MYFTLAVSAATAAACEALTDRARVTDPRIMPVPGPARVAWRSPDGRAAILHWGPVPVPGPGPDGPAPGPDGAGPGPESPGPVGPGPGAASSAGTIWAGPPRGGTRPPVYARTSLTRVDPVYAAEMPGAVVLSDRAMWAAAVAGRIGEHDPEHACALLGPGFPLGAVTPFRGVTAFPPAASAHLLSGTLTMAGGALDPAGPDPAGPDPAGPGRSGPRRSAPDRAGAAAGAGAGSADAAVIPDVPGAADVAAALVAAVAPLAAAGEPVQLSLTGGKDSRLVLAALAAAGVPVRARTHGFPEHPDVAVAARVAGLLGIEHVISAPAEPGQRADVAARLRAAVLVADGMLSAFENVGRPDPAGPRPLTAGGHGGELLRGGYAEVAAGRRAAALRGAEALRRLTTRHAGLLRRGAAASYLASLAPWTRAALARGPLPALDDFYLVNRAGRWSAAARQAYLIRERLVQPLFDEHVVRAARAVPLPLRAGGDLTRAVLAELSPALAGLPFAGKPARGEVPGTFDWRRQYGGQIAAFFRGYILDLGAAGGLFDVVSRPAAEKLLLPPHADRAAVWALATLACLLSGDYRNAREPADLLSVS